MSFKKEIKIAVIALTGNGEIFNFQNLNIIND